MVPIALFGFAALAGLVYLSSKGASTKPYEQAGISPKAQVGPSGRLWRTTLARETADFIYVNVYVEANQFGPHIAAPVLQYRQTKGEGKESRVFVLRFPNATSAMYGTALLDFGIPAPRGG